jgi:hypothetical protein
MAKLESTAALSFSGADYRFAETQPLDVRFGGSLQVMQLSNVQLLAVYIACFHTVVVKENWHALLL